MDDIIVGSWIRVSVCILFAVKQTIFQNRCIALHSPRDIVLVAVVAQCGLKEKQTIVNQISPISGLSVVFDKMPLTDSNVQMVGIPLSVRDARSLPKLFDAWHV